MKKRILLIVLLLISATSIKAQNRAYAQKIIDTLSSASFHGRGYAFNGDVLAAKYIKQEMKSIGVKPLVPGYLHDFKLNVNTFPGALAVTVNGKSLENGVDFIVNPSSGGLNGSFTTCFVNTADLMNNRTFKRLKKSGCKGKVLVIDTIAKGNKVADERKQIVLQRFQGQALIEIEHKLTWGVGRSANSYGAVKIKAGVLDIEAMKAEPFTIEFDIENEFVKGYEAYNVCGMIEGTRRADSFVFFTAHYDHLGRMGKDTYIPGANDNASGVAMMLDMARHFKENPPEYSVVFIGFGGEEAGLVGSYYFVKQMREYLEPEKIRFVINMDLMGSGEKGIMAVNGKVFKGAFEILKEINDKNQYLPVVKSRGKAANSDHYFFSESGIPAFFFYLMGEYKFYHEVDDSAENLRLGEYYDKSFRLIRDFLEAIQDI